MKPSLALQVREQRVEACWGHLGPGRATKPLPWWFRRSWDSTSAFPDSRGEGEGWLSSREGSRKYLLIITVNTKEPAEETPNWQGPDLGTELSQGQARSQHRGLPRQRGAGTRHRVFRRVRVGDKGPGLVRLTHTTGSLLPILACCRLWQGAGRGLSQPLGAGRREQPSAPLCSGAGRASSRGCVALF